MYMAPIVRATPVAAPAAPAFRRAVGVPVLAVAAAVALPWIVINLAFAALLLAGRFAVEAVDYAGKVALGR